jgi:hypothetical protein
VIEYDDDDDDDVAACTISFRLLSLRLRYTYGINFVVDRKTLKTNSIKIKTQYPPYNGVI